MQIEFLIAHLSSSSVLIPLFLAVIQWNRLPTDISKLRWIILIALFVDALSLLLIKLSINTYPLGNSYLLIQFVILLSLFSGHLKCKVLIKSFFIGFMIFYLVNLLFLQNIFEFNTNSNVAASLILIFLTLLFFYNLLNELPIVHIHKLPMLWISFATLVYYAGTLFLFLANNYLTRMAAPSHKLMWILHNLLNITKNLLFAIALWQSYRKTKSSTSSSWAP